MNKQINISGKCYGVSNQNFIQTLSCVRLYDNTRLKSCLSGILGDKQVNRERNSISIFPWNHIFMKILPITIPIIVLSFFSLHVVSRTH